MSQIFQVNIVLCDSQKYLSSPIFNYMSSIIYLFVCLSISYHLFVYQQSIYPYLCIPSFFRKERLKTQVIVSTMWILSTNKKLETCMKECQYFSLVI